jgi:hypothetical protein
MHVDVYGNVVDSLVALIVMIERTLLGLVTLMCGAYGR